MSAAAAVGVAVVFTWLGMVLAISFLEAPLKFRAPEVTVRIGLGIGRLVFRALNGCEAVFGAALIVTAAVAARTGPTGAGPTGTGHAGAVSAAGAVAVAGSAGSASGADGLPGRAIVAGAVAIAVLLAQLAVVRPRLSRRSDRVLAGEDAPRSRGHLAYVALETVKAAALLATGILLLAS